MFNRISLALKVQYFLKQSMNYKPELFFLSDCIASLKTTFEEDGSPIDDNNQTLQRFCAKLEYLLQHDLKGLIFNLSLCCTYQKGQDKLIL